MTKPNLIQISETPKFGALGTSVLSRFRIPQGPEEGPKGGEPNSETLPTKEEIAALKKIEAEYKELKQQAKAREKAEREIAEKAGNSEKVIELLKAQLSEYEKEIPYAQKWKEFEASELKRLDEVSVTLPESFKSLYAKAADLSSKKDILSAYESVVKTTQSTPGQAPGTKTVATPPNLGHKPGDIDFDEIAKSGNAAMEAARRKHPTEFNQWSQSKISSANAPRMSGFAAMRSVIQQKSNQGK